MTAVSLETDRRGGRFPIRRVAWVALLSVGAMVGLFVAAIGFYHWGRFRGCQNAIVSAQARHATSSEAAADWDASALETFSTSQAAELRRSAERWGQKVDEILSKGRSSTTARVYLVGDMVYFVFFGPDDRVQDFVCVGN
jgi:hypothetical protein